MADEQLPLELGERGPACLHLRVDISGAPPALSGRQRAHARCCPRPSAEADELELELDYQPEEADEQYQYDEAEGGEEEAVTEDAGGGEAGEGGGEVQGPAHPPAAGVSAAAQ